MKYALTYQSISKSTNWEHIRFETEQDFTLLQSLIGEGILFGVEKKRPSKRLNYASTLHVNDTCHVIQPLSESTSFSTQTFRVGDRYTV